MCCQKWLLNKLNSLHVTVIVKINCKFDKPVTQPAEITVNNTKVILTREKNNILTNSMTNTNCTYILVRRQSLDQRRRRWITQSGAKRNLSYDSVTARVRDSVPHGQCDFWLNKNTIRPFLINTNVNAKTRQC